MTNKQWDTYRLSAGVDDSAWEIFHENSKTTHFAPFPSDEETLSMMQYFWEALPFENYPKIELPAPSENLPCSLSEAIVNRVSTRDMKPIPLSLKDLSSILFYSYGITRDNLETGFPRPFRTIPSAGAMYPLELFLYASHVEGLDPGIYHYNPNNYLRLIKEGDLAVEISNCLVQSYLAHQASAIFFITAMFERSTFKYGDRGYRFVFLESGHLAQNMNLISTALGLASLNIGGYFDSQVDALLNLDGLTHSTTYAVCVGGKIQGED